MPLLLPNGWTCTEAITFQKAIYMPLPCVALAFLKRVDLLLIFWFFRVTQQAKNKENQFWQISGFSISRLVYYNLGIYCQYSNSWDFFWQKSLSRFGILRNLWDWNISYFIIFHILGLYSNNSFILLPIKFRFLFLFFFFFFFQWILD